MIASDNDAQTEPGFAAFNGLPVTVIRGQLDRVLHSRAFVHSHRIRRFLEFVVEESLTGQQHRLKEYLIGLEVFNRLETFDPRVDSIVRVEARRLRAKLDHYYRTEGKEDEIRIEMRKGSYVPCFEPRRDWPTDSYPYQPPIRSRAIALAPFTVHPAGEARDLLDSIKRRITHVLVSEGFAQVVHDDDASAGTGTVDFVLHGNVECGENGVKTMLQLKSVPDGVYFWSSDGSEADGDADIEEMARSLNRALATFPNKADHSRTYRHRIQSRSFDSYIQGRYLWKNGSPEAMSGSSELFAAALEEDLSYASAWAALAQSLIVSSMFGLRDCREIRARIEEAARKAHELNDGLPEAHLALGLTASLFDRKWQQGEQSFVRAIQLDARNSSVHAAYALQLACRGMTNAALVQIERALELDPACLNSNFILGWLQGVSGNVEEAISQHNLITQLAPDFALARLGLGWASGNQDRWADALEHFKKAASLVKAPALIEGCLGAAHAWLGNRREALLHIERLTNQSKALANASIAAVYAGLGDTERAFQYLNQAADEYECSLALRILNPEFKKLRSEPRFAALLARIGLKPLATPEYISLHPPAGGSHLKSRPMVA